MNKSLILSFVVLTALVAGCGKPSSSATSPGSAPYEGGRKTSFQEVTAQLDPGGSLYLYLATDQWLEGVSGKVTELRGVFTSLARPSPQDRAMIDQGFAFAASLIRRSGIEELTGVGLSAAPVAEGLYRNKLILHHASGGGKGLLWTTFGQAPHALTAPDMLPATTALAIFGDLNIQTLWEVLLQELQQSGFPPAEQFAASLPQQFEQETGLSLAKLLASIDGEAGLILTLDPEQSVTLPMGGPRGARGSRLEISSPGLVIAVKVKNDYLYDHVAAQLKQNPAAASSDTAGLKLCSMEMPNPMQLPLQLTVASGDGYFYFATSPELVRTVQAVRSGKTKGLKAGDEFQKLARYLPTQGNQLVYVSAAFGETVADIQRQVVSSSGLGERELRVLQNLFGAGKPSFSLSVGGHTATGWQSTTVGNRDNAAALLLAPTVGVSAVSAALLLPALAKAKGRAQSINSVNNLKQLALGARMYANDHGDKLPPAATWCDDLNTYVVAGKTYKAPNDSSPERLSYAYNAKIAGKSVVGLAGDTVLFFEAEATWNTSGGQELHLVAPRGGGTFSVAFVDGSVRMLHPSAIASLRWEP